ncbi:MAG: metal ABC transporter permease [SAR324 cluster bacterium]|nr:metal ABC transporter permease [SAR324 cluster bacterium]
MIDLITEISFLKSILLAVGLISALLAILGTFVTFNNLNYLSSSLTHASLGGIGVAIFVGLPVILLAPVFALLLGGAVTIFFYKEKSRIGSFLDLTYALGMALGIFLITISPGYQKDFSGFLFGNLLLVSDTEVYVLAAVLAMILIYLAINYRKLLLISFDAQFASTCGINVKGQSLVLILALAFTLPLIIKIAGITLTIALISVAPLLFEQRIISVGKIMIFSYLLNLIIFGVGIVISFWFDWPTGSITSLVAVGIFVIGYSALKLTKVITNKRQSR